MEPPDVGCYDCASHGRAVSSAVERARLHRVGRGFDSLTAHCLAASGETQVAGQQVGVQRLAGLFAQASAGLAGLEAPPAFLQHVVAARAFRDQGSPAAACAARCRDGARGKAWSGGSAGRPPFSGRENRAGSAGDRRHKSPLPPPARDRRGTPAARSTCPQTRLVLPPSIGVSQSSGQPSCALRTVSPPSSSATSSMAGKRQDQIARKVSRGRAMPMFCKSFSTFSRSSHRKAGRKNRSCSEPA